MSLAMALCSTAGGGDARGDAPRRGAGLAWTPSPAAGMIAREASVEELRGKICVVTGATSGIGRATAEALSAMGAELGIVCRDRARGEELRTALLARPGCAPVRLFVADLAVQSQ